MGTGYIFSAYIQSSSSFSGLVKAWRYLDLFARKVGDNERHALTTTIPLVKGSKELQSQVQSLTFGNELATGRVPWGFFRGAGFGH